MEQTGQGNISGVSARECKREARREKREDENNVSAALCARRDNQRGNLQIERREVNKVACGAMRVEQRGERERNK